MSNYVELKRHIVINNEQGEKKSSVPFWQEIERGDVIEITTQVGWIGRGAQDYILVNTRTGTKFRTTGGLLGNKLSSLDWLYVD